MNAQIVKLFGFVLVLFATLVGFTSYWSVFDAEALREHPANRRALLEEQRIRRGVIRATDGTLLAASRRRGKGNARVYVRRYPQGPVFAHAIGYNFAERGRSGVERSHNDDLVGRSSEFVSIVDQLSGGRREGDDLRTTLNPAGQRVALRALAGRKGSVVAIEPATGKVRVMANVSSYDPNRIPKQFGELIHTPGSPLLNRATQAGYPAGSTFKVVTAAAALDSGKFTPASVVDGRSGVPISGVPLNNFGGRSFGRIDLTTALTNSVNTVWAQVAESLGAKTMYRYMKRFGFNAAPPMDYPRDQMLASGVYQGRRLLDESDPVDIGRVAIGQERLRVSPLQMAMIVAAVANGGLLMKPRLWERLSDADGRTVERAHPRPHKRVIASTAAGQLTAMMTQVVREGTGTAAALQGIDVAGKTGTAERTGTGLNQAWFVGFAPAKGARIAVAVTVERTTGQGGTVAAPIAKQVMQALVGRLR